MDSNDSRARRGAALSSQAQYDALQAEFLAGGRKPLRRNPSLLPRAQTPTDDLLHLRLAEEIDYGRRMLDAMSDELSHDATVRNRHMCTIQSIEAFCKLLGQIANVIRSSDPQGAVEGMGACELTARLKRSNVG